MDGTDQRQPSTGLPCENPFPPCPQSPVSQRIDARVSIGRGSKTVRPAVAATTGFDLTESVGGHFVELSAVCCEEFLPQALVPDFRMILDSEQHQVVL